MPVPLTYYRRNAMSDLKMRGLHIHYPAGKELFYNFSRHCVYNWANLKDYNDRFVSHINYSEYVFPYNNIIAQQTHFVSSEFFSKLFRNFIVNKKINNTLIFTKNFLLIVYTTFQIFLIKIWNYLIFVTMCGKWANGFAKVISLKRVQHFGNHPKLIQSRHSPSNNPNAIQNPFAI